MMETAAIKSDWVLHLRPGGPERLKLFCFPYSGGGSVAFRPWANTLPPTIDICPIQLPGREDRFREAPYTHLEPLMPVLIEAIQPHLEGPFAFFGHSMGTLVAFELARELARRNCPGPLHLFVSGLAAPHLHHVKKPVHDLPDDEFIVEIKKFDGTPNQVLEDKELAQIYLPILRADFTVYETYTYTAGPRLECPISAFGGLQDNLTTRSTLEAWQEQTTKTCKVRLYPGGHFFLNSARPLVLNSIVQDLIQSQSWKA